MNHGRPVRSHLLKGKDNKEEEEEGVVGDDERQDGGIGMMIKKRG
jgi:hypothetical protein